MRVGTKVKDIHTEEVWFIIGKPNPWSSHYYVSRDKNEKPVKDKSTIVSGNLLIICENKL